MAEIERLLDEIGSALQAEWAALAGRDAAAMASTAARMAALAAEIEAARDRATPARARLLEGLRSVAADNARLLADAVAALAGSHPDDSADLRI